MQDIYQEALCHLALCQRLGSPLGPHGGSPVGSGQGPGWVSPRLEVGGLEAALGAVRERLQAQHASPGRHPPLLLVGQPGAGKTSLLATIYRDVESWLGGPVNRIVRFCGQHQHQHC